MESDHEDGRGRRTREQIARERQRWRTIGEENQRTCLVGRNYSEGMDISQRLAEPLSSIMAILRADNDHPARIAFAIGLVAAAALVATIVLVDQDSGRAKRGRADEGRASREKY